MKIPLHVENRTMGCEARKTREKAEDSGRAMNSHPVPFSGERK